MLEMKDNVLHFSFPEVHPYARCTISFIRTLRVPDLEGESTDLPPGFGPFPLKHVEDFADKLEPEVAARGGVALPMYTSEAMFVRFESHIVPEHGDSGTKYPFAVKIGTGKRSAVTGKEWSITLREGDYVILPKQPWIDGFVNKAGQVKQFLAMELGRGVTAEEQITGEAKVGGLQIEVIPMKAAEFLKRFPKRDPRPQWDHWQSILRTAQRTGFEEGLGQPDYPHGNPIGVAPRYTLGTSTGNHPPLSQTLVTCSVDSNGSTAAITMDQMDLERHSGRASVRKAQEERAAAQGRRRMMSVSMKKSKPAVQSMGLAPGGKMRQEIYADTFGFHTWDQDHTSRTFVHLFPAMAWKSLTGQNPPTVPPTAADYARHNIRWFAHYAGGPVISGTDTLHKMKSLGEIQEETGNPLLPENEPITSPVSVHVTHGKVSSGNW